MSESVRPVVGDVIRVVLKGTVTSVRAGLLVTRIYLSTADDTEVSTVSFRSDVPEAVPEITVLGHEYQPGDVADITMVSGCTVRAMLIRYLGSDDEAWVTKTGTHLRAVDPSRITLVRCADEDS